MVSVSAVTIKRLVEVLGWDLKKIDKRLVHSVVLIGQLFGEFLDTTDWTIVDGYPYSYEVGEALNYVDSVFISVNVDFNEDFIRFVKGLPTELILSIGKFVYDCVYSGDSVCDVNSDYAGFVLKRVSELKEKLLGL